jgi:transglutaminase-like putative cysteine protease
MTLGFLPGGATGTSVTLNHMVKLARDGSKDPLVNQTANALVAGLPQYDRLGEIRALHAFVRDGIRYTNDPLDTELLRTPRAILEMKVGDCDDKSTLLASLLRAVGRPSRFVAIAMNGSDLYSHVLVQTPWNKGWMSLETIKPVEAGWSPAGATKVMVRNV